MLTDTALRNLKPKYLTYKASDRDGMCVTVSPTGTVTFRYDWLQAKGSYSLAKDVFEVARVALQVNVAKEGRRVPRSVSKALEALVG